MTTEKNVITALAAVMAELPSIGKDQTSNAAEGGYKYRGIEDITKVLQPLLAKHGVVIVPGASITSVEPSPAMKDGWQDVYIVVDWKIYGPGGIGDMIEARTSGIGRDRSDKGYNKSQTQAYKYLLLHLFSIADTDDDSDGKSYEHDRTDGRLGVAADLSEQQAAAEAISKLSGADKALVNKRAKEAGITNVMRAGDRAGELIEIINNLHANPEGVEPGDLDLKTEGNK